MTRKELDKRAVILNVLELAFNEKQDLYGLEIEQVSPKENLFKCRLYEATTYKELKKITANYGTIKRYVLSLSVIRACECEAKA